MQTGPFQIGQVNGIPVVEVAGDVDLSNSHMLQAALEQAARTAQRTVVVSLGGGAYFDSQGMHMLLRFNRRLEISRRRLVVVVPWHHPLKSVMDSLGAAVNVTVVQTLAEAIAAAQFERQRTSEL
jgi:anti-anti-sigma factor